MPLLVSYTSRSHVVFKSLKTKQRRAFLSELEEDESTFDSRAPEGSLQSEELIEEGEARLLIQLKEQSDMTSYLFSSKEKASSTHLKDLERAKAYNALAQVSLTSKGGLKQAVVYAQLGAALSPKEIKLSTLIKAARAANDWRALEPLWDPALTHRGIGQTGNDPQDDRSRSKRRSCLWLSSYLTLIQAGAEEASSIKLTCR